METLIVQVNSDSAYRILEELEELHLIKVIKRDNKATQKLSEKYAGKLSAETVEKLQKYTTESRKEWGSI